MQPQTKPQPDLQALALTKAIRQHESGGNYNAVGDNATSTGAYQFQDATWKAFSKQILGVDNAEMTEANQNAVAYGMIKTWKDQGLGPAEIAAKWNSGSEKGWENKIGTTTRNGKSLDYNVPQYVQSVVSNFKQIYPQVASQYGQTQGGPGYSSVPTAYAATGDIQTPQATQSDFLGKAQKIANIASLGIGNKVGESIGTLGGLAYEKLKGLFGGQDNSSYYDTSAPSVGQVLGDVAQGALAVGTGMPEGTGLNIFGKTLGGARAVEEAGTLGGAIAKNVESNFVPFGQTALGRVTKNAAIGAGFGLTQAFKEGNTSLGGITKDTLGGAALGGLGGVAGEALGKLADIVPKRIMTIAAPMLRDNPDAIDAALSRAKIGTLGTNIKESQAYLDSYKAMLAAAGKSPELRDFSVSGTDLLSAFRQQFPNSELDNSQVFSAMKKIDPNHAALVTKLEKGTINFEETNTLKQALDKKTYKINSWDAPEVRAGKEAAAVFGNTLRQKMHASSDFVDSILNKYHQELYWRRALEKLSKTSGSSKLLNTWDVLTTLGGTSVGGIPGAILAEGTKKALTTPGVRISAAVAAQKAAPIVRAVGTAAKVAGATGIKAIE